MRLGDIIALDEDDIVAIVTRELLETYPLFTGNRVKISNSKSMPQSDKEAFTSLMTLYSCHLSIYKTYISKKDGKNYRETDIKNQQKIRPSDAVLDEFKNLLIGFWDCMESTFVEIQSYIRDNSQSAAKELRSTENGGNLFFRPIGLLPFVEAISKISLKSNSSFEDIIRDYANLDRNVHSNLWDMILWNPMTKKMIMRNQALVYYLLIKMRDINLLTEKEKSSMNSKYATIFNIELDEAERRISEISL